MKWFYNLKIAQKLVLSFIVVLVLTSAVSMFSIMQLGKVNQASVDIATNWLPTVRTLADLKLSLARIRGNQAQISLFADDPAIAADVRQRNAKQLASLAATVALYETQITEPMEKEVFPKMKAELVTYLAEDSKITALAMEQKQTEARTAFRGDATRIYYMLLEQTDALSKVNLDGSDASNLNATATFNSSRAWIVSLAIGSVVLGMLLAIVLARMISRPLLTAVEVAERVAAGDLTATIVASSNDETGRLMHALHAMNDSLRSLVGQVRLGTDTIATASSEIATGNLDLSSRTEEQASSLEETASAMEEMTSTVKQNSDNARQANQLAVTASQVAEKGGVVVGQVVDTMHAIDDSAHKIMDIISVIEGIAFQTNILALNAAVEAARAGEQGRGFAVVASEVRNLAQRSATAAKEIKVLIDDSVDKVSTGSRLVESAGQTMEEVVASVKRVTDIVGEISMANQEQSVGIDEINRAVMQMDQVTQQNAALVEEAAAAAASLQDQAQSLAQVVSVFKLNQGEQSSAVVHHAAAVRPAPIAARPKTAATAIATKSVQSKPATTAAPKRLATAASGDDWETF